MKKILLSTIYFLAGILSIKAQILYGTTRAGGSQSGGTINKFLPATNNLTVVKTFASSAYGPANTNFIQTPDGKLYGMATDGGRTGEGVIFSFDLSSANYTILHSFDFDECGHPQGSLIRANNGKLYGMTCARGSGVYGIIFSYDPTTSTYTKIQDPDHNNIGGSNNGSLLQASDGKLYGMALGKNSGDYGVIFSFDPSTSTYKTLKEFDNTNGATPYGSLIQASDGKLYAMTHAGGSSDAGVIFSYDPSTSIYSKLKDFDNADGARPEGDLMQATDGKLYGMTVEGGINGRGVVFSFDPSTSTYTRLKDLDGNPTGNLIQASDGKLYGMTNRGGSLDWGVIFSIDLPSSTYTKLKDFDLVNGARPYGSLMQASDGKLYAMTHQGGSYDEVNSDDGLSSITGVGVIFSFEPATSVYTKLKDLGHSEEGAYPTENVMQANDGKLYGMTPTGGNGAFSWGVIYSFEPSTSTYTKLKDFDFVDGAYPDGRFVQATDGKLYGTAVKFIFSFDASSSTYTTFKQFTSADGTPEGTLLLASDGKLYGTTCGSYTFVPGTSDGTIYSFDPVTSIYTKLKDINNPTGFHPGGSLLQASDGKLYGCTARGGSLDSGVIFSFDPLTSLYTKLKDLNNTTGSYPTGGLIQAMDGKLYGMTYLGGIRKAGVIFSFDPSASTYTKLYDFDTTNGANPLGSLMQASDGKLYGMANGGIGYGVIFSFDPATGTYTKLQDFNDINGSYSSSRSGFIELLESPLPVTLISFTGKNMGNNNQLSWKVANEQHLNYYELQRSIDGQNFNVVSQIKAAGNNNYTYNDPVAAAASSLNYYRLKSVDKDGKFKFSLVIKIRTGRNGFAVVNPNPFKNKLVVNIESFMQDKATLIINDIGGKQLYKETRLLSAGSNVVEINEVAGFSKGTYLFTIITSQQTQSIKVVKGN